MENNKLVLIEDTRFIFETNFSGDPKRDKFGKDDRNFNIILPDDIATQLIDEGFNVKCTKPNDEYDAQYFVKVNVKFECKYPPRIYLVSGDNKPELLNESTVGIIDGAYVKKVNATLSKYYSIKNDKWSLYVRVLYVEQEVDNDPFAARYRK